MRSQTAQVSEESGSNFAVNWKNNRKYLEWEQGYFDLKILFEDLLKDFSLIYFLKLTDVGNGIKYLLFIEKPQIFFSEN